MLTYSRLQLVIMLLVGSLMGCGNRNTNASRVEGANSDAKGATIDPNDLSPPDVVTGLTASVLGAFQISLSWAIPHDDRGVSGFRLMRDQMLLTEVDNRTTYVDSGLTPKTTYVYQILALDNGAHQSEPSAAVTVSTTPITGADLYGLNCAGCHGDLELSRKRDRSFSEIKSAVASEAAMNYLRDKLTDENLQRIADALSSVAKDKTAPATPGIIGGSALGPTAIALNWTALNDNPGGSGMAGYRLFRNGNSIVDVGTSELAYTDTNLTPDTDYVYQIAGLDLAGNVSGLSPVNTIKTRKPAVGVDSTAPSIPNNLSVVVLSATQIKISWSPSVEENGGSGLKAYRLYRNNQMVMELGPAVILVTDTNLAVEQSFSYAISAGDNADNWSAKSANVQASTPAANGLALYHTNCELCHFEITQSNIKDKTAIQIKQAIADKTIMQGLNFLGDGELAAISSALATIQDTVSPTIPSQLTAVPASYQAVNLSWAASTDAGGLSGYQLFRGGLFVKDVPATPLTTSDDGLTASTLYNYKIRAKDLAGNFSGFSTVVSVTTANAPTTPDTIAPSVPAGFSGVAVDHRSLSLTWTASSDNSGGSGIKAYRIWRDGVALPDVNAPAITIGDAGLLPSTTYRYTIKAIDFALNQSAVSAEISITTTATNGAQLYATNCERCHHPLATSEKLNKTADEIVNAIATESGMSPTATARLNINLTTLTRAEINAIAAALIPPPDTVKPSVPSSLAGVAQSATAISLTWGASTDVGGSGVSAYRVYRNNTLAHTVPAPAVGVAVGVMDTLLTANTQYTYKVSAVDVAGNVSANSTAVRATTLQTPVTPDTTPPPTPSGLRAVAVAYNRINLTWLPSIDTGGSGTVSYKIMRGTTLLATVLAPSVTFAHTNIAASTTFTYQIKAVDGENNVSALTAQVSATTPSINGAALYATNCERCHHPLATSEKLNKTADEIVNAIATKPGMSPTATARLNINLTTLTRAEINAIAAALIPPPDTVKPSVPSSLAGVAQSATAISLTWGASTDNIAVVSYRLYRGTSPAKNVTGTATTDTGLTAATTYTYKVSAVDAAGNESLPSSVKTISTPSTQLPPDTTPPSVPGGVVAHVNSYSKITLNWTASRDNVGVTQYKVFRDNRYYKTVLAPAVSMIDSGLADNTIYKYTVAALDSAGNQSNQSVVVEGRTPVINGKSLYNNKCSGCHGRQDPRTSYSRKLGATATLITDALANPNAMGWPSTVAPPLILSTYEIAAIVTALRVVVLPPSQIADSFTYIPPVGTRQYLAHKFRQIFLPVSPSTDPAASAQDAAIDVVITKNIFQQVGALGGPCSRYDAYCQGELSMAVTLFAPMLPVTNAARRGYMTRACDEVLSRSGAVSNALARAGLSSSSVADAASIKAIYQLFYLNDTPAQAVSDAILDVHQGAKNSHLSNFDAWRYSLTAVCDSVGVDSL